MMTEHSYEEEIYENLEISIEEFNPNLTTEDWKKVLYNDSIFTDSAKRMIKRILHSGGYDYCENLELIYGNKVQGYNSTMGFLGSKIATPNAIGICPKPYSVIFAGKYINTENGRRYLLILRPELWNALEELGGENGALLKDVPLYEVEEKRKYFACGFNWKSEGNKYDFFIKNNCFVDGFGQSGDEVYKKVLDSIKINDILVLKTSFTKGENHSTSVTKFYAIGIVTGFTSWFNINVKWLDFSQKEFNNIYYGKTIDEITHKNMIDYINSILDKNGDTQMTDNKQKLDEYIDLLEKNNNLIFHGAPGTGKTFTAKEMAQQMIFGKILTNEEWKDEKDKKQWDEQFGFVQFHPSYDYTDFVEGLRPSKNSDGNVNGFERVDGVFKKFCERAAENLTKSTKIDNFEESWCKLVEKLNEDDFINVPLISSKTRTIRIELNEYGTGLANRTYENDEFKKDNWISGKSKFFSKDQLYNIYKGLPGVPAGGHDNYRIAIVNYMKEKFDLKEYKNGEAEKNSKTPFIFLIDEINRGETSKIFGELFFSIDPGYRGTAGRITTQYQNLVEGGEFAKGFYVPDNVFIIGTMNDIDRSVETMDFAFRRRFAWKEITAESSVLDQMLSGVSEAIIDQAKIKMDNINQLIRGNVKDMNFDLGESYCIGGAYFKNIEKYLNDTQTNVDEAFESLWKYHICGLITEYLRGQEKLDDVVEMIYEKVWKMNVDLSEDRLVDKEKTGM